MDTVFSRESIVDAIRRPSRFSMFLDRVVDACVYLSVFLVPLWFLPMTLDTLELNKQTLLVLLTMVAIIAWLGKAVAEKTFSITRSWLHIVVALFGVGYLVTSLFSQDRYLSLVGNFGQMQWAFSTVLACILFYFVATNAVKTKAKLYDLVLVFLASSTVVAVYGLLQMLGAFAFAHFAPLTATKGFNTIGSLNALAVYLAVPLVIAASLTVLGCKDATCMLGGRGKGSVAAKVLVWLTMLSSLAVLVVVDFWVAWAAVLFGMVLLVGISFARMRRVHHPIAVVIPGVLCLVSALLLVWRTPFQFQLPGEVSLSLSHSWQIARQALQEKPLFGSGPGTWIYDYSLYRAPSVNQSQFWTVRFDHGISTFFTLLATLGLVGMAFWLILVVSGVVKSAVHLVREKNDDSWQVYLTVFSGWATAAFIAFFYNYAFSHQFVFWFLLALLAALVANGKMTWDGRKGPLAAGLLSTAFLVICACAIAVGWLAGQRLAADAEYSTAVNAFHANQPIQTAIDHLNSAVALNRLNDAYYRNLSQAYLIRAGQELQGTPDKDKAALVNSLVSAAIDTGVKATQISPANVDNWTNIASVYQSIASFTRGADEFAIKDYQEALAREPNNPVFYEQIGKIYILRSDAYRTLLSSSDAKTKADAQTNLQSELDKAAVALNQSIQVKPDYAPAHYDLGILYEREGRLKDAITKLEQVLRVNNQDVGVGFQLAILYYRNGDKDKAADLFGQIVNLEPDYANARWYLSVLEEEQGKYADALAQVQEIAKTNSSNQLVTQRLQQLQKEIDAKSKPAAQPIPAPLQDVINGPTPLNEVQKP
jgi:tetratricopeptide (TPR) repeat protein